VKLLRVLQDRELERLGSNRTRSIDVRVIAATNVDLRAALEEGRFREDLYYRLNVIPISIPPLRDRREDIAPLVLKFAQGVPVSPAAMERLLNYSWPGNIRELQNVMERSLILRRAENLDAGDIKLEPAPSGKARSRDNFLPDGMTLDEYEQSIIREALRRANGNKSMAARMLGLTRNAFRYRLDQMGIAGGPDAGDAPDRESK
jgi:DNA-binding NtrC family response regulator